MPQPYPRPYRPCPEPNPTQVRVLTHPAAVTVAKTAVTQIVYETSSDSVYLAMQV